jgi:hypothetical protein
MALLESHCKGTTKTAHLQEQNEDSYPNLGQNISSAYSFTGKYRYICLSDDKHSSI